MSPKVVTSHFLRTKLYRPTLPADHVYRLRLVEKLNRSDPYSLTLISAPAGYGKTSLVSAWIGQNDFPCSWLSLDKGDDDLAIFLGYFINAIRTVFPHFGTQILKLTQIGNLPPLTDLTPSLINEIDQLGQNFALILDDYHVISDSKIHALLDNLLLHPPRYLSLIITTRYDPPLYLAKLRASHQVMELRAKDLRFSAEEAASFIQQTLGKRPNETTIALLAEKTEGWPVSLRLATIALSQSARTELEPSILQVENQYLIDYLVHEVLSHQPTAVTNFLLYTAILERFCAPLCTAVTQSAFSEVTLQQLEHLGLFIEPLDAKNRWYRFHQLFRHFLRQRLQEQLNKAKIATLHLRASSWLAENGFVEDAIDHALQGGSVTTAVTILRQQCHSLMNEERWQLLERLLAKFSADALQGEPVLLLLQAWLNLAKSQHDAVASLLKQVQDSLKTVTLNEEESRFIRSSNHIFSAIQLNWATKFEETISHAQRALAIAPAEWLLERSYAWLHLATATYILHGISPALAIMAQNKGSLWFHEEKEVRNQAANCFVYWLAADLPNLLQTAKKALKLAQKNGLAESPGWFAYFVGSAAYHQNDLNLAEQHFKAVMAQPYQAHPQAMVQSAIGLAKIYQAQNLAKAAWETTETAVKFCLDMKYANLLLTVTAYQAELAWQQGNRAPARHWQAQAESLQFIKPMPYLFEEQMTSPRLLIAENTRKGRQQATLTLARIHESVTTTRNTNGLIEVLALQALLWQAEFNEKAADEALTEALLLARPSGFIRLFVDLGAPMQRLLKRLAAQRIAPTYIEEILAAFPTAVSQVETAVAADILVEPLTSREVDILILLAERLSNKEIAESLVISPATVKRHTINIYQKLSVNGRREAVTTATSMGLLVSHNHPIQTATTA